VSPVSSTSLISRCSEAVARAGDYIRTRQSPSGGFCFYRYASVDEPSLGDTYHAVAALRIFGLKVPSVAKTVDYLAQARIFGLTYLYFCVFTLDLLGSRLSDEVLELIRGLSITVPETTGSADATSWLESARKTIRLQQRFTPMMLDGAGETLATRLAPLAHTAAPENCYAKVVAFMADILQRGGFGIGTNLWDTHLAISVGALLGLRPPQETVAFVDSLQQPPIGFLMTRNSVMSSLDVAYAGAHCCEILGLPVRYREEVIDFTLACQASNGGFAHAPMALPNIEFTYLALKTLAMLVPEMKPRPEKQRWPFPAKSQ
jgi:hypothetical protein